MTVPWLHRAQVDVLTVAAARPWLHRAQVDVLTVAAARPWLHRAQVDVLVPEGVPFTGWGVPL